MKYENMEIYIKDVQKVQLELLLELDRVCKKHRINYQLFAGTLLGAIRHKGFIPWDDDADVCLLRKDYEKLLEVCKKELDESYFLQNYKTDTHFSLHYSKLRKNNTLFRCDSFDNNTHEGIYIDIFPMDNVKPYSFINEIHRKLCSFVVVMTSSMMKSRCYVVKTKTRKYVRLALHYLSRLFSEKAIHTLANKIICMFNHKETGYVGCLTNGLSKKTYNNFILKKDTLYDTIEWEFEGHKFPIPREYDYVLTKNYGIYMTPPPLEEQKPHHGIMEVNFDTTSER